MLSRSSAGDRRATVASGKSVHGTAELSKPLLSRLFQRRVVCIARHLRAGAFAAG